MRQRRTNLVLPGDIHQRKGVGGRFDPAHLRFPWNLIPALKNMPASDLRDWEAIRAWAGSLVEQFQPVGV